MKTAPAVLVGTLLIVSLCSCGMDRPMSSFDQEIALQNLRIDQRLLQQQMGTAWAIQEAQIAHKNQEDLIQQMDEVEVPVQTQHALLHSDPESAFAMRDDQNRIRTIGKPALIIAVPSLVPNSNETDSEDRHDFMK